MSKLLQLLRLLAHVLVLRPFVKIVFGVAVIGGEYLQNIDRYVIIANHNSHLDICLLFSVIPLRDIKKTHAVADRTYFASSKLLNVIVTFMFDPLWVDRGSVSRDHDPLEHLKKALDDGRNLIIFPEGTRGKPGELKHFKGGIGRLAAGRSDVPVVPVFMSGPERALPKASRLPLPFWNSVIIGPPQVCSGTHREITRSLEHAMMELSQSEIAMKHKRAPTKKQPARTIAFLGIDGSGKSTLSRLISEELSGECSVCLVSDNLAMYENGSLKQVQPLIAEKLREAVGSYAKSAASLKNYKIPKLAELLLRDYLLGEIERWYHPDCIVLDGSPLLNMVAWAGLYRENLLDEDVCSRAINILTGQDVVTIGDPIFEQFNELKHMKRLKLNRLTLPDSVFFIDVPPSVAIDRIETRGEQMQVHETEEKLDKLRSAYHLVCRTIENKFSLPVVTLDGAKSREELVSLCRARLQQTPII